MALVSMGVVPFARETHLYFQKATYAWGGIPFLHSSLRVQRHLEALSQPRAGGASTSAAGWPNRSPGVGLLRVGGGRVHQRLARHKTRFDLELLSGSCDRWWRMGVLSFDGGFDGSCDGGGLACMVPTCFVCFEMR